MHKHRLEALADGIFAIVMTILVFEIRLPEFSRAISDQELWMAFKTLTPALLSYVLSFLVLTTYWVSHNFIITTFAKNLNRTLAYLNMPFFMAVALIPFSAHMLGRYYYTQLGLTIYSAHIIVIGLLLTLLLYYVIHSKEIKNVDFSLIDTRTGYSRALVPVIAAFIAIFLSFVNTTLSLTVLTFALVLNVIPPTLHWFFRVLGLEAKRPV